MRNPLETGISGLALVTLITGCTAVAEPQPTAISILVPTATPHVRVEPTATPLPPSEAGRTVIFPITIETKLPPALPETQEEQRLLSVPETLLNDLENPTQKAIGLQSFREFIEKRGYKMNPFRVEPGQFGKVLSQKGIKARLSPTTEAQELGMEYLLKHDRLIPIEYVVIVQKKGENEIWIARYIPVKISKDLETPMWVYYAVQFINNTTKKVETLIKITPPK